MVLIRELQGRFKTSIRTRSFWQLTAVYFFGGWAVLGQVQFAVDGFDLPVWIFRGARNGFIAGFFVVLPLLGFTKFLETRNIRWRRFLGGLGLWLVSSLTVMFAVGYLVDVFSSGAYRFALAVFFLGWPVIVVLSLWWASVPKTGEEPPSEGGEELEN